MKTENSFSLTLAHIFEQKTTKANGERERTHFNGGISAAVEDLASLNDLDCCHCSVNFSQWWIFLCFSEKVTMQGKCDWFSYKVVGNWNDVDYRPLMVGKREWRVRLRWFVLGMMRLLLRCEWVQKHAERNMLSACAPFLGAELLEHVESMKTKTTFQNF